MGQTIGRAPLPQKCLKFLNRKSFLSLYSVDLKFEPVQYLNVVSTSFGLLLTILQKALD